jgi:aminomethyltransferase
MATSITWGPTVGKLIGFGHIEKEFETVGTRLTLEWPMGDGTVAVDATISELPFLAHRRA